MRRQRVTDHAILRYADVLLSAAEVADWLDAKEARRVIAELQAGYNPPRP